MDQYYNSNKFRKLLARYEHAAQSGESLYMDADDLTDIAEYYQAKGQTSKALAAIAKEQEIFPEADQPKIFMSRFALVENGDTLKARAIASGITDKNDTEYILLMAEIMLVESKDSDADEYIRQELIGITDDEDKNQFRLDVAGLYIDYNLTATADKWLKDYDGDKADPYYKELRAHVLMADGHYEESEQLLNDLLNEDPFSSDNWNSLAQSQFMHNDIKHSIDSSDFSLAIDPDNEDALINKANALFTLGNYEEAYKYYSKFSELEPNNPLGELFTGLSLINMERDKDGLDHLLRAMDISGVKDRHLPELYQEIALTLCQLKRPAEAHQYLDRAKMAGLDNVELYITRGHIYLSEDKRNEAWEIFHEALNKTNFSIDTFKQIALTYIECGYVDMGSQLINSIIESGVDNWYEGYAYLARCGFFKKDWKMMTDNIEIVCRKSPETAQNILSDLFPEGTQPESYPEILNNLLNKNHDNKK